MERYQPIIEATKEKSSKMRSIVYREGYIAGGILFVGLLIFTPIIFSADGNWGVVMGLVATAGGIFFAVRAYNMYKELKQYVKENIVKKVFEQNFANVEYRPASGFDRDYIRSTEMVAMGNIFSSNDFLSGEYKGVTFEQCDVEVKDRRRSGKTTYTVTLFKGRWLVYRFNKEFEGYLQLRDTEGTIFGKNKKPFSWFTTLPEMNHLKFENEEFNQRFTAYSSNPHEAYYLVTPHFMEKILTLDKKIGCTVIFGFINNELHVACYNNDNAFEVAMDEINAELIQSLKKDLQLIKDVVDTLNLDVKIT